MALIKKMELPDGSACEYWKVTRTDIDWHNKVSHVVVSGFLDKNFRHQEEPKPLPRMNITFDWVNDNFPFDQERNVIRDVYLKIKGLLDEMNRTKIIEVEEERTVPFEELEEDEVPGETYETVLVEQEVPDPIQVYSEQQLFLVDAIDDLN